MVCFVFHHGVPCNVLWNCSPFRQQNLGSSILFRSSGQVSIFTDHQGLIYFAERRDLGRRQAGYLDLLSEFTGARNTKADAFTRM